MGGGHAAGGHMIDLHVGAHKTASTHLQRALDARRAALAAAGVAYFGPGELRGGALRLGLIAAGTDGAPAAARRLRARLTGLTGVLVSEENILGTAHDPAMLRQGRFYPGAEDRLRRVMAATGATGARLHLAVRDPAGFVVSAYGQRLFSGVIEPFEVFLRGRDPATLRWSELVARLLAVKGVETCTVWRFEDWPAIAPKVLARMLPGDVAVGLDVDPGVTHPGLSQRGVDEVMQALREGRAGPDAARKARRRFPKSASEPAFQPFADGDLARSAAAYDADLARIAALPGVAVLGLHDGEGEA